MQPHFTYLVQAAVEQPPPAPTDGDAEAAPPGAAEDVAAPQPAVPSDVGSPSDGVAMVSSS